MKSPSTKEIPSDRTSSELIYHFPMKANFWVLFDEVYSDGKYSGFKGSEIYLIAAWGMTGFSVIEPIHHANSTNFASGIIKIQLRPGFATQVSLTRIANSLGISRRRLIYFKQISTYYWEMTTILCWSREYINILTRVLKLWQMNAIRSGLQWRQYSFCYMHGTAPRSPEPTFSNALLPLDRSFFHQKTFWVDFYALPTITFYSHNLASCLSALCKLADLLVKEQRAYHCEFFLICVNMTKKSILSEKLCLLYRQFALMLQKARSTNSRTLSLVCGGLLLNSLEPCTRLSTILLRQKQKHASDL